MEPINILVIDDESTIVDRLMRNLKRHDVNGCLGEYYIESDMLQHGIEEFDVNKYDTTYDVVLIDYQLNCPYTGTLVSAWMLPQLHVPRLTLTSGIYSGNDGYFDDFIEKNEITDSPAKVIQKIIACINRFNYSEWLEKQYQELVQQYTALLTDEEHTGLIPPDKNKLNQLGSILDKFEKILDSEQEKVIKEKQIYIENHDEYLEKESAYLSKMAELQAKLNQTLTMLDKKEG